MAAEEMARLYRECDVFVACGLCEPWGIRVNDAIHAGAPVAVSRGMGAAWLVDQFGCGCTFKPGDAAELADILERMSADRDFLARLRSGARAAGAAWTPEKRARVFIDLALGSAQ